MISLMHLACQSTMPEGHSWSDLSYRKAFKDRSGNCMSKDQALLCFFLGGLYSCSVGFSLVLSSPHTSCMDFLSLLGAAPTDKIYLDSGTPKWFDSHTQLHSESHSGVCICLCVHAGLSVKCYFYELFIQASNFTISSLVHGQDFLVGS